MGRFRCIKWQDHDGVWHYQMVGPGRMRKARRKWQREGSPKAVPENAGSIVDPEFEARMGYVAYLLERGIISR